MTLTSTFRLQVPINYQCAPKQIKNHRDQGGICSFCVSCLCSSLFSFNRETCRNREGICGLTRQVLQTGPTMGIVVEGRPSGGSLGRWTAAASASRFGQVTTYDKVEGLFWFHRCQVSYDSMLRCVVCYTWWLKDCVVRYTWWLKNSSVVPLVG